MDCDPWGDKMFKTVTARAASIEPMEITSMKPRLVVPDPDEAIDFYREAIGAELEERYVVDGLVVHAAMTACSCGFSIAAEVTDWGLLSPVTLGGSAMLITLEVDDAREVADRMVDRGSEVLVPVEDRPYGRCEGRIRDPFGHLWIPTHEITGDAPDGAFEGGSALAVKRIVADLRVTDTRESADFFRRLLDLDLAMDLGWVATLAPRGHSDRQLTVMTADATAPLNPHISVEVNDLDVVWQRAQDLGAEVVHGRTVESWGVERFFVRDPSGNIINILSHAGVAVTGR